MMERTASRKGEIVLANRGTEPAEAQKMKDLFITDAQIFCGIFPKQFEDAIAFYDTVNKLEDVKGKKINITGHSLGGGISQYLSVMGGINVGDVKTWNGVGVFSQKYITNDDFGGMSVSGIDIYTSLLNFGYIDNNGNVTEKFKYNKSNIFKSVSEDSMNFESFKTEVLKSYTWNAGVMNNEDCVKVFDKLRKAKAFAEVYNAGNYDDVINYVIESDIVGTALKHVGNTNIVNKNLISEDSPRLFPTETFLNEAVGMLTGEKESIVSVPTHGFNMFLPFMDDNGSITGTLNEKYIEAVIEKVIDDKWDDYASVNRWMSGDTTGIYDKLVTLINNSDDLKLKDNIIKNLKEEKLVLYMTDILKKRKDFNNRTKSNNIYDYLLYNTGVINTNQNGIIRNRGLVTDKPTIISNNVLIDYQNQNNTIFGTEEKDVIRVNDDNSTDIGYIDNKIFAGGGKDFVFGGKGEDIIYGGAGDDSLVGGVTAGNDKDDFADRLIGGEGDDHLLGGSGYDEYVFDLSEDSGNDLIVDTDKRGTIKIIDEKVPTIVQGDLIEDDSKTGGKISGTENVRWRYGKYNSSNGSYSQLGTCITLVYTNNAGKENHIIIENFVKQYSAFGGTALFQEEILGLKFPSIFTGSNEKWNAITEPFIGGIATLGTLAQHGMAVTWSTISSGFQAAMNTGIRLANKGCKLDPLILDLDGDGVETSAMAEGTYFDLNGDGSKEKAGWVGQDDGLLVYDRNSDGIIDSGRELFGDQTRLRDGRIAESGFEALSEFDSNSDGIIDKNDRGFGKLQIWQDINSDGISQNNELKSLNDLGIASIDLKNETVNKEINGNIEVRTSNYTKENKDTGIVAEYLFANDIFDYSNTSNIVISEETKNLLNVSGSGLVLGLQEAMELKTN